MFELERERRDLQAANIHLKEGEDRVAQQKELIATLRDGSPDRNLATNLLVTLEDTLAQWRLHQEAIVARIKVLEGEAQGRA